MRNVLVLNSDGNPVSMLPLSVISWQEGIKYMFLDKATVLEWYEDWTVHSMNWSTRVPAVIILKEYMRKKHTVRFSKQNVFLRDLYQCCYCGVDLNRRTATLDHILPQSCGGKSTFENTCTACSSCNSKKGNDPKIKPAMTPRKPNYYELVDKRRRMPIDFGHPSWGGYLGLYED